MNATELKNVKQDIRKFHELLLLIIDLWKDGCPHFITLGVLVQNAGFYSSKSYKYDHDEDVIKFEQIINVIDHMYYYHVNDHVVAYVKNELDMILMCNANWDAHIPSHETNEHLEQT